MENLGVCSRNVVQDDESHYDGTNIYWEMEHKYHVLNFLKEWCITHNCTYAYFQGESAGPKVQENRFGLTERRLFGFNFGDSNNGQYRTIEAAEIAKAHGIEWVPIIDTNYALPNTMEEIKATSAINNPFNSEAKYNLCEGIVYHSENSTNIISFKNVCPDYLIRWKI